MLTQAQVRPAMGWEGTAARLTSRQDGRALYPIRRPTEQHTFLSFALLAKRPSPQ